MCRELLRATSGLIVWAADAGIARDGQVAQHVAAVADGVCRDEPNEAHFNGKAGGAACRGGAAAEQAAESVFGIDPRTDVAGAVWLRRAN